MTTDRVINIPGILAAGIWLTMIGVMLVGIFDLLEFCYRIAARLIH